MLISEINGPFDSQTTISEVGAQNITEGPQMPPYTGRSSFGST